MRNEVSEFVSCCNVENQHQFMFSVITENRRANGFITQILHIDFQHTHTYLHTMICEVHLYVFPYNFVERVLCWPLSVTIHASSPGNFYLPLSSARNEPCSVEYEKTQRMRNSFLIIYLNFWY